MTAVIFENKLYRVVPDSELQSRSACTECAFLGHPRHKCGFETWGGESFSDGPAISCIDGGHHYKLAEDKEQA